MHLNKLSLFLFLLFLITACNDKQEIKPDEDNYCIQYGDSIIETNVGLLYLYDTLDDQYCYVIITGNSGWLRIGWSIDDVYSRGDYVKLHFRGDTITNLQDTYSIIDDSNSYIVFDYNDTLDTYSLFEYITSGELFVQTYGVTFPRTIRFQGKTESGTALDLHYFVSSPDVSYKIARQVQGNFRFKDTMYDLSSVTVISDSLKYNMVFYDLAYTDSIIVELRFYLYKDDHEQFTGSYYGADSNEPNSFKGFLRIVNLEDEVLYYEYIFEGETEIALKNDNTYNITFNLITEVGDTIAGYWQSPVDIHY